MEGRVVQLAAVVYSSSILATADKVRFVFNIVEIPGGQGHCKDRQGVCTGWLARLTHADGCKDTVDSTQASMDALTIADGAGEKKRVTVRN